MTLYYIVLIIFIYFILFDYISVIYGDRISRKITAIARGAQTQNSNFTETGFVVRYAVAEQTTVDRITMVT
jgi:hypothetical protein